MSEIHDINKSIKDYFEKVKESVNVEDLDPHKLIEILNNGSTYIDFPILDNPRATYGADSRGGEGEREGSESNPRANYGADSQGGEGEGEGSERGKGKKAGKEGRVNLTLRRETLERMLIEDFEINFEKKGKELSLLSFQSILSKHRGTFDEEATFNNYFERKAAEGRLGTDSIEISEEDVRRRWVETREEKTKKGAVFIAIADKSSSMNEIDRVVRTLSFWIVLALEAKYGRGEVKRAYILHSAEAIEVSEKEFFNSIPSGGTTFASAYHIVLSMLKGEPHNVSQNVPDKVKYIKDYDVYIVHFTDGENSDESEAKSALEKILSPAYDISKFTMVVLRSDYINNYSKPSFPQSIENIDKRRVSVVYEQVSSALAKKSIKQILHKIFN
ncbi:MAG: DUF444 family protein [Candidatus Rehaiarchaeum fermentans]|nr:DUF444 family protein [Candidatus Rehaiarchaeum fermentans]